MPKIDLKQLSDRQRQAWRMRYRYGWKFKRIAAEMGITESAARHMLRQARQCAGLPNVRVSVIRTKPRLIRAVSLSDVWDQI
jgi:DNA-binding transcriptional regulator LsrR (DeoR family)